MEPTKKKALLLGGGQGAVAGHVTSAVTDTLRDLDVQLLSGDEVLELGGPAATVTDAIQKADLIVADVSLGNANVLYELGYAHALRKPTLVLLSTEASGRLPSDLASYQMITYDPKNLSPLRRQIQRFLDYQMLRLAR